MTEDLTGTWEGIYSSGTVPAYAAYGGAVNGFDRDLEIHRTTNIPERDFGVRLVIASHGAYRKFGTWPGPTVSVVAGQLDFLEFEDSAAVSGFVDDSGLVSLAIYESGGRHDHAFIGRLTHRGLTREISGNLMRRVGPGTAWQDRYSTYYFGRLSVSNNEFGQSDRADIVESRHIF